MAEMLHYCNAEYAKWRSESPNSPDSYAAFLHGFKAGIEYATKEVRSRIEREVNDNGDTQQETQSDDGTHPRGSH